MGKRRVERRRLAIVTNKFVPLSEEPDVLQTWLTEGRVGASSLSLPLFQKENFTVLASCPLHHTAPTQHPHSPQHHHLTSSPPLKQLKSLAAIFYPTLLDLQILLTPSVQTHRLALAPTVVCGRLDGRQTRFLVFTTSSWADLVRPCTPYMAYMATWFKTL